MSNIVLNTITYVGEGFINGATRFMNRAASLLSGFSSLFGRVNTGGKRTTVRWNLTIPVLVPEDSACGCGGDVKFITYAEVQVKFDARADATHRADVYTRLTDLLASSQVESSIKDLTLVP